MGTLNATQTGLRTIEVEPTDNTEIAQNAPLSEMIVQYPSKHQKPVREEADRQEPQEITLLPPILKRIAECESNNTHYDENGDVILGNQVKEDTGRYQINTDYWGEKAKELGWDLFNEKDNALMALWIYERHGSSPWSASKHCWSEEI